MHYLSRCYTGRCRSRGGSDNYVIRPSHSQLWWHQVTLVCAYPDCALKNMLCVLSLPFLPFPCCTLLRITAVGTSQTLCPLGGAFVDKHLFCSTQTLTFVNMLIISKQPPAWPGHWAPSQSLCEYTSDARCVFILDVNKILSWGQLLPRKSFLSCERV